MERKSQRDKELEAIIRGEDQRILLVIGPCSSDNEEAVLEYAKRLAALQEEVADRIFMVMRVYTAKPRTNGDGYKGLIHQLMRQKPLASSTESKPFDIFIIVSSRKQV